MIHQKNLFLKEKNHVHFLDQMHQQLTTKMLNYFLGTLLKEAKSFQAEFHQYQRLNKENYQKL